MTERQMPLPLAGAAPQPFTSFASRSQIDRAGVVLRDWWASDALDSADEVWEAWRLVSRFRAEFATPLTKVVMGMRSFMNSEGLPVVVAQRLKRMPTMLDKLTRIPTMKVTRMQDIGGCRVIVPTDHLAALPALRRRMQMRKWRIIEEYDYVTNPKPSGYRALHVVVERDGRLIEVQIRTALQHRWAVSVESLGPRVGFALKDGVGPEPLLEYFRYWALLNAMAEAGQPIPPHMTLELMTKAAAGTRSVQR